MTATERALELQPRIREVLGDLSQILEPRAEFRPLTSNRVFRIMASDYAEATLIPALVKAMRSEAPNVYSIFLRLAMFLIGIWSRVKSIWRLIALTKSLNRSIKY